MSREKGFAKATQIKLGDLPEQRITRSGKIKQVENVSPLASNEPAQEVQTVRSNLEMESSVDSPEPNIVGQLNAANIVAANAEPANKAPKKPEEELQ
jgi:hypothetical protein